MPPGWKPGNSAAYIGERNTFLKSPRRFDAMFGMYAQCEFTTAVNSWHSKALRLKSFGAFFLLIMLHLDQLIVGYCPFRKGDRVWIMESWGLVAGVIELVGEWIMSDKAQPNTPFVKVEYDFPTPHGKTESHFWREDDLKKLRRQHPQSNCCGAPFYSTDRHLHGKCTECGENATPMDPDEFQLKQTHKIA